MPIDFPDKSYYCRKCLLAMSMLKGDIDSCPMCHGPVERIESAQYKRHNGEDLDVFAEGPCSTE